MQRLTKPLALCVLAAAAHAQVTTPEQHLGRAVGGDFELADWDEVSSYFHALSDQSPNVSTSVVGKTTEGRDFLLSVISSEENLARLPQLKEYARRLADPRGRSPEELAEAVAEGRVFLFIASAMHATESAAPQWAMEFAHDLATGEGTEWERARREVVVLLLPSLNPDGQDHVVHWYREHVGTPYESSALLKLYQYYAGHDNNRDWFMCSLEETRLTTRMLYSEWFPQVYWDVHQQGGGRERFFVPPFRDPLNPNVDPGILTGIHLLGTRALRDMTAEGLTGISTGVSYDMWWTGGNRNVPVRHNIIGLLTEAASVRIATPVFLPVSDLSPPRGLSHYGPSNRFPAPWPGGWWRLRDIIDYEHAFGRSLLGSLSREPRLWRENALAAAQRAVARGAEAPRAWLLPSDNRDPGAVGRLVDALLLSGVEIHASDREVEADGRAYPAGTLVLFSDQPYAAHVKDLFEVQRYPEGDPPYDVAGWTLPVLMGVRRVEVQGELDRAGMHRVGSAEEALDAFRGDPRLESLDGFAVSLSSSASWPVVFKHLASGGSVDLAHSGELEGVVRNAATGKDRRKDTHAIEGLPRVGLYAPWRGLKNEGWMRWVLDHFELPYVTVRNEHLRAGDLADFLDVLVLPSLSTRELDEGRLPGSVPPEFTRGLGPDGAVAVEEFVRRGGRLVATADSAAWARELFGLPLVDVTVGEEAREFSCPGSVLRGVPTPGPVATAGLPASVPLFFSRSSAWRTMSDEECAAGGLEQERRDDVQVLLRYAPTRTLVSGWIREPEVVAGRAAWVRARHGDGTLDLFGFRPQYRSWSQAAFHLLFRAILIDAH